MVSLFKKILKFDKLYYLETKSKPQILLLVQIFDLKFYQQVYIFIFSIILLLPARLNAQVPVINRKSIVDRHKIVVTQLDSLSSLSVGNGNFCFTVDPTGLQSFPEHYVQGVPLGTQSSWGWHSFPNDQNFVFEETFKEFDFNGKKLNYSVQGHELERRNKAVDYFRSNPHRLQLANIGFEFAEPSLSEVKDIRQHLDLWTGTIHSQFTLGQFPVKVTTVAHPDEDLVAFRIRSKLSPPGQIKLKVRLPAPTGLWKDVGNHWFATAHHRSSYKAVRNGVDIRHQLDTNSYMIQVRWRGEASFSEKSPDYYIILLKSTKDFDCSIRFVPVVNNSGLPSFAKTFSASKKHWKSFWMSGGAVDFSGSSDPRAFELERRAILSQYLTRIQCASDQPPQETGLTYNSWYGRPHLEMYWWHALHFVLWGRPELMEKSLAWFFKALPKAKDLARRQGYLGARWQKMTDMQGHETPSSVGSFLVWQQPHIIYLCEYLYKLKPSPALLAKYRGLVFETADFMADYMAWDTVNNNYRLGPGLIPAQESHDPMKTVNPSFELAYWRWAMSTAQAWRNRLGLPENKDWANKLNYLAPLPIYQGTYLSALSAPDSYSNENFLSDHPSVLAAYAGIPLSNHLDTLIMNRTLDTIMKKWNWQSTWGWDYPLIAMAATRLNRPDVAIEALMMDTRKNTYLPNGHNYQDPRLTIYLPGNGGLLNAIAMMCAGVEKQNLQNPGFPKNGKWKLKYTMDWKSIG